MSNSLVIAFIVILIFGILYGICEVDNDTLIKDIPRKCFSCKPSLQSMLNDCSSGKTICYVIEQQKEKK